MISKKKTLTILLSILLTSSILLIVFAYNNVSLLFIIANGCYQPSNIYYFTTERIFENLDSNDCTNLTNRLSKSEYEYLYDIYIHVLGVAGCADSKKYFIDLYLKCREDPNMKSTCIKIVNAMGYSNSKEYVPFLESLLEQDSKSNLPSQYYVSRALYLITGNLYPYYDNGEKPNKLVITEKLKRARSLLSENDKGQRTAQKMVAIDKLFRPPGW
ncbi:hypothetical protein C4565_09655 [Candidatus Parcubacteria bacterium]|nr:MAG: hypothetical protein C4565_09655 [Candidatus Parcubacteria bacterium]